jgi:hypothetical protein
VELAESRAANQGQGDGLVEALRKIAQGAPTEEDFAIGGKYDYDEGCGNSGDVRSLGEASEHFRVAKIAREALANFEAARTTPQGPGLPL